MKELKELILLTESGRVNRIEGVNYFLPDKEQLTYRLYTGIRDNIFTNEQEAREALYGKNGKGVKYDMLKKRLKERLQMGVLFPRTNTQAKSFTSNFHYCYKNFAIAKLLTAENAKKSALELVNKVFSRAQKFELFELVQDCATLLRRDALIEGNIPKFNKYNKIFDWAHSLVSAESKAEEIYYSSIIQFSKSLVIKPGFFKQVESGTRHVKQLKEKYNTAQLNYYLTCMEVMHYQLKGEYDKVTQSCENFEKYLRRNPRIFVPNWLIAIRIMKMDNYLILDNYSEGKKCAEETLKDLTAGSINWYYLLDLYFLLSLNTGNYEKASEIYSQAVSHPAFNNLKPNQQEIWRIYSGYLWFLLTYENNLTLRNKVFQDRTTFPLSKLLNEIPVFSQDKKGLNIAILVLQQLILLQEKKFDQVISRTESLKNYISKNLSHSDNLRSQLFIKLLIALERRDFDLNDKTDRMKKLENDLNKINPSLNPTQTRIEIVPYQRLWEIVEDMLSKHQASLAQ